MDGCLLDLLKLLIEEQLLLLLGVEEEGLLASITRVEVAPALTIVLIHWGVFNEKMCGFAFSKFFYFINDKRADSFNLT